jgi:hypothetical protein
MRTSSRTVGTKRIFTPDDNKRYARAQEIMKSSWNKPPTWSNDKYHWDAFSTL